MQLDVLFHHPIELLGWVQEMRRGLVPKAEGNQFAADVDVTAHQFDVAVEADAGIAGAAVDEVGFAARRSRIAGVCVGGGGWRVALVGGLLGDGASNDRASRDSDGADADPQLARQLGHCAAPAFRLSMPPGSKLYYISQE